MDKEYILEGYKIEESLGFLANRLAIAMRTRLNQELKSLDLTTQQWVVLYIAARNPESTAGELAEALDVDAAAVTRMTVRLEEKGLLRRVRSKKDKRIMQIEVADKGLELLPKVPPLAKKVNMEFWGHLRKSERKEIANSLYGILTNYLGTGELDIMVKPPE